MALPSFVATVMIQRMLGIDPDGARGWRTAEWIATAASVGVIAALGGVAFYGSNANFPELSSGNAFGFALPRSPVMVGLLWGEYRGLFFWCIGLLMAVPGLVYLFRKERAIAVMVTTTFLVILLQNGAFYSAFGGNSIGPRYLFPALPFIGLAAAYGIKQFSELGLVLTTISVVVMGMVTAIAINPAGDVLTPLQSIYLARIETQRFADNLGTLIGLPLWLSLVVPLLCPAVAVWLLLREPRVTA